MDNIVKNIRQAFDTLPERYKDKVEIMVSSMYYGKNITIGKETKPQYNVYNMDTSISLCS